MSKGHSKKIFWLFRGPKSIDEFKRWTLYVAIYYLFLGLLGLVLLATEPIDLFGIFLDTVSLVTGISLVYCISLFKRKPERAVAYIEKIFFIAVALTAAPGAYLLWFVWGELVSQHPLVLFLALFILFCGALVFVGLVLLALKIFAAAKSLAKKLPQQADRTTR